MIIYHGSKMIIEKPIFGQGNIHNDYGLGFYCTESLDLAKEWACVTEDGGYANRYEINLQDLNILELSGGQYHILNWLAILLENRIFPMNQTLGMEAREYIVDHFGIDYRDYDVITGYRADDSYFSFAKGFLNNTLSLQKLEKAMLYGKLGIQIVLKSEKAFQHLVFQGYEEADGIEYYSKRSKRDQEARDSFRLEKAKRSAAEEVYMLDILRGRWTNDDPRLQRIVLR